MKKKIDLLNFSSKMQLLTHWQQSPKTIPKLEKKKDNVSFRRKDYECGLSSPSPVTSLTERASKQKD